MNLCSAQAQCSVSNILDRIEPIQYEDGTLVVSSPLTTSASTIYINNHPITTEEGVLDFPSNSTVDQEPLQNPPFTGDTLELPHYTTINDFNLFTSNYYYFWNNVQRTTSGRYMIPGGGVNPNPTYNLNGIQFPFIAPKDCVLTSLLFSFVGNLNPNLSTITDIHAYIMKIDGTGTITDTGISVVIPSCPPMSKQFADKTFQYPLNKGEAVGVRYTFVGTINATFGGAQFATLGYKFLT